MAQWLNQLFTKCVCGAIPLPSPAVARLAQASLLQVLDREGWGVHTEIARRFSTKLASLTLEGSWDDDLTGRHAMTPSASVWYAAATCHTSYHLTGQSSH